MVAALFFYGRWDGLTQATSVPTSSAVAVIIATGLVRAVDFLGANQWHFDALEFRSKFFVKAELVVRFDALQIKVDRTKTGAKKSYRFN